MVEVPNRNRETLEQAIMENIRPGTRIYSDGWAAYNRIEDIGGGIYTHEVIIHQQNFVDPGDRWIHTQTIESS